MRLNKKTKILIVLAAISLISIIFILVSTRKKTVSITGNVEITSSTPLDKSIGFSVFNPVRLVFNQEIDPSLIEVFSDPSETWVVSQTVGNSVDLNHQLYLRAATKYKLTTTYNGAIVGILNFETAREQNDPRLLQTLQTEMDKDYPLAKLTPYETPDYKVIYAAPLTLEIDIKSQISTQEATLKIKSWVSQHGVNPSTHKYTTVVLQ